MRIVAVIATLMLAGCTPSSSSTFAGTWGVDPAQCKIPQEMAEAPMILTEKGYDQHEAHCTFSKVTATGAGTWNIEGACTVEGNDQTITMALERKGDTLTIDPGPDAKPLVRCP